MTLLVAKCGPNEWGNEVMREIATHYLSQENAPDAVEVREHGGWFLTFGYVDGELEIVGTANDRWVPPLYIREWWQERRPVVYRFEERDDSDD